jgi:putative ABC transport system permease protein
LQPGGVLPISAMYTARGTEGVAWSEPLIYGQTTVQLPAGGVQAVTLAGTKGPRYAGGPWNMVRGDLKVLAAPDTMIFEDSERELLGGLNLGSVREVGGHRVVVGGFVWGLLPFGPSFAFADFELARELAHMDSDQAHFLLVGVQPGQDARVVAARIAAERPDVVVKTKDDFSAMIIRYLLLKTPIGVTFGSSTIFALIVGFVIVSLSMFSSVLDNVREFGTLKALGATFYDLTVLLVVQAVTYALMGTIIGLSFVTYVANAIRSPKLGIQLPWQLLAGTTIVMILICVLASSLALLRLRKVEPAMVFR